MNLPWKYVSRFTCVQEDVEKYSLLDLVMLQVLGVASLLATAWKHVSHA